MRQQRLAQRGIERVDRAVAGRHRHQLLAIDIERHGRLGFRHQIAAHVPAPLVHDAEARQLEEGRQPIPRRAAPAIRS